MPQRSDVPDFSFENARPGPVFGCDEVGRAPLAGPVVAACVYIPEDKYTHDVWKTVDDSKKLSKKKRAALVPEIKSHCVWGIGQASAREIETLNIVQASFLAMARAFEICMQNADKPVSGGANLCALIDGHIKPKSFPCPVETLVKGDSKSVSIAAASILAKVHRDTLMEDLSAAHPGYGWERNAGYPTKEHIDAIGRLGLTPHHRRTFAPVRDYIEKR